MHLIISYTVIVMLVLQSAKACSGMIWESLNNAVAVSSSQIDAGCLSDRTLRGLQPICGWLWGSQRAPRFVYTRMLATYGKNVSKLNQGHGDVIFVGAWSTDQTVRCVAMSVFVPISSAV